MSKYHEIDIGLEIDNSKVDICNSFSVSLELDDKIYKTDVKGCSIKLPRIKNQSSELNLVFSFGDYLMKFDSVKIDWLYQNRRMNWNFVVKNKPFNEPTLRDIDKVKVIYYWQFYPEEGEGVEIIKPIYQ